jgi:hypothetical protein
MSNRGVRTRAAGLLILLAAATPRAAQDRAAQPPDRTHVVSCESGAVDVEIDRNPALRLVPLNQRPNHAFVPHEFTFEGTPFPVVRVYFTATMAEHRVWGAAEATLSIYVETAASLEEAREYRTRWWQLVGGTDESPDLMFSADNIRPCFNQDDPEAKCSFADISAVGPKLPLIQIGFSQITMGANATGSTETRLLLDFRAAAPRVAVTATCGYHEGGGACTAIDSGMYPRSSLACSWEPEAADFLCLEQRDSGPPAHRDFYLLSGRAAPVHDVVSLEQAAAVLARGSRARSVMVAGFGLVSWIDEIAMDAGTRAMLLGSARSFFLAVRSNDTIGPVLQVVPHPVLEPGEGARAPGSPSEEAWEYETVPLYRSRLVSQDRGLTVLEIVKTGREEEWEPAWYWIGIERAASTWSFDAVELAGSGTYESCGKYIFPASVTAIGKPARPFRVSVRIQPPMRSSLDSGDAYEWVAADQDPEIVECVRDGTMHWRGGRFETEISSRPCRAAETPQPLKIPGGSR